MTMPRKPKDALKQSREKAVRNRQSTVATQSPVPFDSNKLRQLYVTMLKSRMAAERAHLLVKQGKLSGDLGATGQEAAEVGVQINLLPDDCVALCRRDLIACLIRGTPLKAIFTRLYVRQAGLGDGFGIILPQTRSHVAQPLIAPPFALSAQLNLVTGVAWSLKRHERPGVAVAFSGDDSASLGFWRDAVSFSAAHKLPIVHVVHNNAGDGSIGAKLSLHPEGSAANSQPLSLPAFNVDGNDVVAVYRVAQEAIRRARQGYGPALIECQTYRWCQLETDSASRRPGTVELEQSADPLARMEAYLEPKRLWSDKWKRKLVEHFSKELDKAVEFAERSLRRALDQVDSSRLATAS